MLTDAEKLRYTAMLERAEAAYDTLMLGGQVVDFTDQNGERVRYSAGNADALFNYINRLRAMLGLCPYMLPAVSRPAGVLF